MPTDTWRAFDAELHGSSLHFGSGKKTDAYVIGWTDKSASIVWPGRVTEPASFEVELTYDAEPAAAGSAFTVTVGGETLTGTVKPGTAQTVSLGRVTLKAGNADIKLAATEIKRGELMRPRSVTLKPGR
jgi:hypothetical protein